MKIVTLTFFLLILTPSFLWATENNVLPTENISAPAPSHSLTQEEPKDAIKEEAAYFIEELPFDPDFDTYSRLKVRKALNAKKKSTQDNSVYTTPETWLDRQHQWLTAILSKQTDRLNESFGHHVDTPPDMRLRIFLDTHWNEGEEANASIHVRANVKLPNANAKFRLVFSDDPLDEQQRTQTSQLEQHQRDSSNLTGTKANSINTRFPNTNSLLDNASIALRYQLDLAKIQSDVDIGLRSGPDVFLRTRLSKDWQINKNTKISLGETLRYGSKSRGFALTDFKIGYEPEGVSQLQRLYNAKDQPLAKPLSQYQLSYAFEEPKQDQGFTWTHNLSQRYLIAPDKTLSYGWLISGNVNTHGSHLDHSGPWAAWRQSIWRSWFFISAEAAYFNDKTLDIGYNPSALVRMEALFASP